MLSRDSEDKMWPRFVIWPQEVTLARWTQPPGPLCLWQCFSWMWTVNIGTLWSSFLHPANMCLLLLIEDKNENHYLLPEGHRRWMVWSFWYLRCTILYFIEGFKHPATTRVLFWREEKIKISTFCPQGTYLGHFDISEIDQFQVNRNILLAIMIRYDGH